MYYLYKLTFHTCRQAQRQDSANSAGARVHGDRSPSCNTFGRDVTIFLQMSRRPLTLHTNYYYYYNNFLIIIRTCDGK